jgi:predicted phage tail protein
MVEKTIHNTASITIIIIYSLDRSLSNLQVTTPTATTLTVTWTASADIEQFEVTYSYTVNRCSDTGGPVTANITNGSMRSYTLNNLNEDSRYTITVRAINTVGSTRATVIGATKTSGK